EGPRARREPKLPTTVSPSGSGAPSNLRDLRGSTRPPPRRVTLPGSRRPARPRGGSPCGPPAACLGGFRLAAVLPRRAPRPPPPLRASSVGAAASALRLLRRRFPSGLAAFRSPSRLGSPCGSPGASSGLLASVLRLLGAKRRLRAGNR